MTTIPGGYKPGLSHEFINIMCDKGLEQLVTKPTRKENILDLFFTTHPTLVEKSTVFPGMSDHDGIPFIIINTEPRKIKQQPRKIYLYKKADVTDLKKEITELTNNITSNYEDHDYPVDSLWTEFKDDLIDAMNSSIPSKLITKGKQSPWITDDIKRLYKRKQRAYNTYKKNQESGR